MNSLGKLFTISEEKKPVIVQIYKIIEDEVDIMYARINRLISRDEIATALIRNPKSRDLIESKLSKHNNNESTLWNKAGNYVDWLNADISQKATRSIRWNSHYVRQRLSSKHAFNNKKRNVWWIAPKNNNNIFLPEEIHSNEEISLFEGSVKQISVNAYERNEQARQRCLLFFGYKCQVCGFNFKNKYGNIGEDYIHVHHLVPLSEIKSDYEVNPLEDLIPVCPNCHAMLHRKSPPFTISELKDLIENKE